MKLTHLVASALSSMAVAHAAWAVPTEWTVASGGNGHWYEFIDRNADWNDARAAALASTFNGMQGHLVTITSNDENTFAAGVANGILAWAGASDNGVEGNFMWADGPEAGQSVTYTNWNPGEPNDCCSGEDFLQINFGGFGGWNDHGGPGNSGQVNGYIVEYSVAATVAAPGTLALVLPALFGAVWAARRRR